jgi:hypothetical protein
MRASRIILKSSLVAAAMSMLFILGGCPKHENFPTQIKAVEAPAPTNFVITSLGLNASGTYDYDLSWTVSDPSHVDRYRLYLVGNGLVPELVQETSANSLPITLPFNAQGLQFGLSTVSTDLVESSMTIAIIPAIPTSN